ncbi:MAG: hypothetical protein IJ137_06115, partial [Eubacterium sp.]|nr:hypothetical protein [Eubacterium sp.]
QEALSRITYQICVRDNHISIRKADFSQTGISDLEEELNRFFGQFIGSKAEFPVTDRDGWDPDPVEAEIIKGLVRLFPEEFQGLFSLVRDRNQFVPEELIRYHEDLGFYTVWLEYIMPKQEQGLSFCFPMITDRSESFMASNCFDLILADQMLKEGRQAIRNNLILKPEEHIMVLTGPNQGGKTTFVRMLGQLFYLGALGVPVPGTVVRMFLPDHIYTHFERQEMQSSQSGKLRDDIIRIYDILKEATDRSLILINEMFASTTLADAAWLGRKILKQISQIGAICLYVTFINELSSFLPGTVSLISEIGEDMEERTYKISRARADGKAYARSMAEKYSLTRESIRERIGAGS